MGRQGIIYARLLVGRHDVGELSSGAASPLAPWARSLAGNRHPGGQTAPLDAVSQSGQ